MTCQKCGKGNEFMIIFRNDFGLLELHYCDEHFVEYCQEIVDNAKYKATLNDKERKQP